MIGRELKAAQCNFMAKAVSHSFIGIEPVVFVILPALKAKWTQEISD